MPAVVVLPAPLGPRSPKISPRRTDRSSSSTATDATRIDLGELLGADHFVDVDGVGSRRGRAAVRTHTRAPLVGVASTVPENRSWIVSKAAPNTSICSSSSAARSSPSNVAATLFSFARRRWPAAVTCTARHATILGIRSTLDVPRGGQGVELTHEARRLDVHLARQLALTAPSANEASFNSTQCQRLAPCSASRSVERVVHGAVREVQTATEGWLHPGHGSHLMIRMQIIL